jgi:hypothetical protein
VDVVAFVALLLVGVVAGALVTLAWAFHRSPRQSLLLVLQEAFKVGKIEMPPFVFAATGMVIAYAVLARHDGTRLTLAIVTLAALVAVGLIYILGMLPLHLRMESWSPAAPPDGWEASVRRWSVLNRIRAALGLVALVAFAASVTLAR